MIQIDGSKGEGGGQVLRTCLSLSALTGQPFRIDRIRANRTKPGLRPQHLTAVRAVAQVCDASVEGDEIDSKTLIFNPQSIPSGGNFFSDVTETSVSGRSAGSVTLILQTILWPLLFTHSPSTVTLHGGTFVPFTPPYHYLAEVVNPAYARFGISMELVLSQWGWMIAGGGQIIARVKPIKGLDGVDFEPITHRRVNGVAAVTNLPSHIPHRMARRAHNLLADTGFEPNITALRERGKGPGAGIVLWLDQAGFSSLGRKGLPANRVAEIAVAELQSFVENGAAVDPYLADQLLVPMSLARGRSTFTTNRITRHTLTQIDLLRQWLSVPIKVQGEIDQPGQISVKGIGFGEP